jgi:hypothetical protein
MPNNPTIHNLLVLLRSVLQQTLHHSLKIE